MHEHGIKVSPDDFGTGYSSLNMLKSLDLDTVKLDKSFFDNLSGDSENGRVVLRSVADSAPGQALRVSLWDGALDCRVEDIERKESEHGRAEGTGL